MASGPASLLRELFQLLARAIVWGTFGGIAGTCLGIGIGVFHAPAEVPGDPLANEWYGVGVLIFAFYEAILGTIVGAVLGMAATTWRSQVTLFLSGLGGAVIGAGLGWLVVRVFGIILVRANDASELASNLAIQATCGFASMLVVGMIILGPGTVATPGNHPESNAT